MPPPSSPVPRLSSAPSDVLTVHTIASRSPHRQLVSALMERDGLPPRPLLGDVISTPRHHLASDQNPQGSASTVFHSARLVPDSLPLRQVVRVGQRAIQGRRSPHAHPAAPLHPLPGPRHIGGHPGGRGGGLSAYLGRRGSSVRFKVSGFFARLYRSKYQLFIFSEGFSRAKPVHRGDSNYT